MPNKQADILLDAEPRGGPDGARNADVVRLLRDPVGWGEHYLLARNRAQRRFWPHQAEDMRAPDDVVIHRDGRETGKSVALVADALHYAFTTQGGLALIAAPFQGHLDTLIEELDFQVENSEPLTASIARNRYGNQKIVRKPYYRIEFTNGSVLHFRPAGAYGEAFRSLHVHRLYVDEAAWIPEKAWKALRMCLLPGGRMRIYSTPNGLRDTTYFRLTQNPNYRQFHWPSWVNPLWDGQREKDLLEFYGGKDSAGWQHEVAGEHGKPAYGAFNAEQFMRSLTIVPEYQRISIYGEDLDVCETEDDLRQRIETILNLAPDPGRYWLGGDLGYTSDPTELVVFREDEGVMRLTLRVHAKHVAYPAIAEIIAAMDRAYRPAGIGVDNGGNGLSVVQDLRTLDKYREQGIRERIAGIDFGGSLTLGLDSQGEPQRKRTKEHMTALINEALAGRRLELPLDDGEIERQFLSHTYTLSERYIIYSKGDDHVIDAVRCAFLRRDLDRLRAIEPEHIIVNLRPAITAPIFEG